MRKLLWHWAGAGILFLIGLGVDLMPNVQGWLPAGIIWGVAFLWAVGALAYWIKYRGKQIDTVSVELGEQVADILARMHKCNLKLKDKAVRQYKTLFTYDDFYQFLLNFEAAMPEHRTSLGSVRKEVGRKKLSKDKIKKRQQIDDLTNKVTQTLKPEETTLKNIIAYGHLLEELPTIQNAKYRGIMKRRNGNKRWEGLLSELSSIKLKYSAIFAGREGKDIERMIDDYLDYSFGGSNLYLFTDLYNWFVPVEYLPSVYIKSGAYAPKETIENRMAELLENITNKINELLGRQNVSSKSDNSK